MPRTIDQNHPMLPGQQVAERLPHRLEIGARAVDHHHGRTGGIAWTDIDDVKRGPGNLDDPALQRIGALQDQDTGLRDQRQYNQRRHHNRRCH